MPELPEVETVKTKLKPLIGKIASGFTSSWPRGLKIAKNAACVSRNIKGRKVSKIWRHGKALFVDFSGRLMVFHLRMSGRLYIAPKRNVIDQENKHVRATVKFTDGTELRFNDPRKFGVIWYGSPEEIMKESYFSTLGPDARGLRYKKFEKRLRSHRGMVKPLLMRQNLFAGIGNIVADETLWEAGIHPKEPVERLKMADIKKLHSALKKVLERGIRAGGTTLRDWKHPDGTSGKFQDYVKVYGRKGGRCLRCGSRIQRIVVGNRGTWICPKCQKIK